MNKSIQVVFIAFLAVAIVGCQNMGDKEALGTVLGGVAGGVLGNQVGKGSGRAVATILGTLGGAAIGGSMGRSFDELDAMKVNQALEDVPDHRTSSWRNPNTNVRYKVTPNKTYYREVHNRRAPCRTYKMQAIIDGKSRFVRGRACRINNEWVSQ